MHTPRDLFTLDLPGGRLRVYLADTFVARARGLLLTACLPADHGLLILPCRSIHTMGMRYPIDALFVDDRARIVDVRANLAPWRSAFNRDSSAVLELASGAAAAFDLRLGDRLAELVPLVAGR